ncbi:iron uptake system protein EfeO [Jatrophihabitans sp. YIM 134969]
MPSSRATRVVVAVATSLFAVSGLAACSSGGDSGSSGAKSTSSTSDTVKITLSQSGCKAESDSYDAGALTFTVENTDATGSTELELRLGERIIGEKENLPPGFSGSFSLQMQPGDYTLYCPGTDKPENPLTISGTAQTSAGTDTAALLQQGSADYGQYIELQAGLLVENTQPLVDAIEAGNLADAQAAYAKARAYYERIEPVAESFTSGNQNLDADIDAREGDVPADQFRGFHRIEKGLWQAKSTAGLVPVATELQTNVTKLDGLVKGLTYQPAEIANGAVSLLDEVAQNKVTGEEERYSRIDLLDFASNVEGAQQAFANLQPGLTKIDPAIVSTITSEFDACLAALDKYKDTANPSGFVNYNELTPADVTALSQAVQALQEPLSQIAGKVVTAS